MRNLSSRDYGAQYQDHGHVYGGEMNYDSVTNLEVIECINRARQTFGGDSRNFLAPNSFGPNSFLDEFHLQNSGPATVNQLRLFTTLGVASHGQHQSAINPSLYSENENELACNLLGSRKRPRETDDLLANPRHQLMAVGDFHPSHGSGPVVLQQSNSVSTGLRLTFEDDRLNSASSPSTSGRGEVTSSLFSVVGEELSTQLVQQKDEIDQFIKTQGEQVRQLLEDKRVRHYRALIATIEEGVSRKLREKDLEMEKVNRRNMELEEHVKKYSLEVHLWQSKFKSSEAQVVALRNNLQRAQQAVALSREQSKEGCGDSEADDAASSHHDDSANAQARAFKENKELKDQRTCRVCRGKDVSILLLPCRHLCLCKDCEGRVTNCPVCQSLKNGSVQVYM